ncbi:MAG: GTPase HflX [Acidimicrobiia bacterium]
MSDRHAGRDRQRLTASVTDLGVVRQRALAVALADDARSPIEVDASLDELERLVDTAGSDVVDTAVQRRAKPDPATYIGRGKAEELAGVCQALDLDLVVVDGELTPVQQRNLQKILGVDVVDRVALILDIFALHATSRAGMAQVELAMNRYRLPRLRGKGVEMSRLGAGIGTRGPGETKLESDRRRVLKRISQLEDELEHLVKVRATQRKSRVLAGVPSIALVGYTNAGKSSLLNRLTGSDVLVEDRLFSTLDATVRKLALPTGREAVLSDTVGFVRNLPHTLVEAFRSTLEEAVDTDLLIHVADAAADDPVRQIAAVRDTLAEIGAGFVSELLVLNKVDIAAPVTVRRLSKLEPGAIAVSAVTGHGIPRLLDAVDAELSANATDMEVLVPFDRGDVVDLIHRVGEILSEVHDPDGTRIKARIPARHAESLSAFVA